MHKTGFSPHLPPCLFLAFVFLRNCPFSGTEGVLLGEREKHKSNLSGQEQGSAAVGGTLSPAEQTPATNAGSAELNSSGMLKHLRL